MTVTMEAGKGITVNDAEPVEWFSENLLSKMAEAPGPATVKDGIVTIMALNGTWRYRLDYEAPLDYLHAGAVRATLIGVDDPIPTPWIHDWVTR